jgi:putative transposase
MPRANRYILPGRIYHLTHRCHDRQFLIRFAKDQDGYRRRLLEAVRSVEASLLTYNTVELVVGGRDAPRPTPA